MADISMADTGPDRRAGVKANGFGFVIAIATVVLTVVGTNVAVGAFLWLALDARMDRIDARMTSLETGMAELKTDIRELRDEARATNTRLSRMEGALGITGPAAPGAAES